jgi:hypothetical protein
MTPLFLIIPISMAQVSALEAAKFEIRQGPLTYPARTDMCELGTEPGCPSGPLQFLGRNITDESGVYHPVDQAPIISDDGNGLYGANICIKDPDFGSKICRVTDYSMGSGFNQGAASGKFWAAGSSAFVVFAFGNTPALFSFSNDYKMTSTISNVRGIVKGGDATHFASNVITFASTDPNAIYEVDYGRTDQSGNPIVLLNKVTIVKNGSPSQWSLTRAILFNFEEANGNCLPSTFFPNWTGTMNVSGNDRSFQISFSDHGQNGVRDEKHPYGATLLAAFDVGKGCRVVNTYGTDGNGPMTITGDWGDTGTALDGQGAPIGTSGGNPLPDTIYLHGSGPMPNGIYSGLSGSAINACTAQTCSCMYNRKPSVCENYYWETATRNIRPVEFPGHAAKGYLYMYKGKKYASVDYQTPTGPFTPLLRMSVPVDQHGSYDNGDDQDDQPGTAQHCDYGDGPVSCVYRFAHTFNTGTNWNFYAQNAEGNVSPNGRFFLFPSDWNLMLGCTDGSSSGCLDNIAASSARFCAINLKKAACQRSDVFVAHLTGAPPYPFGYCLGCARRGPPRQCYGLNCQLRTLHSADKRSKHIAFGVEHDEIGVRAGSEHSFIIASHNARRISAGSPNRQRQVPFREAGQVAHGSVHGKNAAR